MEPFGSRTTTDSDVVTSFPSFLQDWMIRQQNHLDELLAASRSDDVDEDRRRDLIHRVMSHYSQYYTQKSTVANRNVFLLFSAPWLTTLEHALLWLTGFRPSLAVEVALREVADLSEEQAAAMEVLAAQTKMEEKALNDEVARVQESVAGPAMLGVARRCGKLPSSELVDGAEVAVESIRAGMEAVVARADMLRESTALKVVEILSAVQTVKFLAAATTLQLEIHQTGLHRVRRG